MKKFGMELVLLVGILCVPSASALVGEFVSSDDSQPVSKRSAIEQKVGGEYLHTCLTQAQESDQSVLLIDRFFAATSPVLMFKRCFTQQVFVYDVQPSSLHGDLPVQTAPYHSITSCPATGVGNSACNSEKILNLKFGGYFK